MLSIRDNRLQVPRLYMLRSIALSIFVVVLVAVAFVGWQYTRFAGQIDRDVARLVDGAGGAGTVVSDAMLADLPPPAQRYLRYAGVVGKPIPRIVRLTQKGRIRSSADADWMTFEAEETYSTDPPAFVWRVWLPNRSQAVAFGRDEYLDGAGSILIKMLGVYTVASETGDQFAAAGLMRYFNEMMWFPQAFLGPNVTIAPIDDGSFNLTIADRGVTATATLFVDGEGKVTDFRAVRFNTATRTMETWETPVTKYGELAGLRLPRAGSAVWKLKDGDFTYIELEITDLAYDRPLP